MMMITFVFLLFSCTAELTASKSGHGWSYNGKYGPSHWSHYYPHCGGKRQSPIDINGDMACVHEFPSFKLKNFYGIAKGTKFSITNNGHSVQVNINPLHSEDYTTSGGGLPGTYIPYQFHFHWGATSSRGSEHKVDGDAFPMELHIVHRNSKYSTATEAIKHSDGLAVLGVFFEISETPNHMINKLIKHFPFIKHPGSSTKMDPFQLRSLLPRYTSRFFRYMGSLTTPTCNEAVVWTLFDLTMPISNRQLNEFRRLLNSHGEKLADNFRPTQPINYRVIVKSFD